MTSEEFVIASVDHWPNSTWDVMVASMYFERSVSVCVAKYHSAGEADAHAKRINDAIKGTK